MIQLIKSKATYGSLNHGDKMLGANRINDWFSDPEGFLDEIIKIGLSYSWKMGAKSNVLSD